MVREATDDPGLRAALEREHRAYLLWEDARWGGHPAHCPHCGSPGRCRYLTPADGTSRATRTGAPTARRLWRCGTCRRQFSVLTGTVFAGSRLPLQVLTAVIADHGRRRPGSASALASATGVDPASARRLLARLDAAERLGARSLAELLSLAPEVRDEVLAASPGRRRRPRPQQGPSADYH